MSLAAKAANPPGRKPTTRCSIAELLDTLDDTEAAALRTMLAADLTDWPHNEIENALREEGHTFGAAQVGRHRRRQCGCYR